MVLFPFHCCLLLTSFSPTASQNALPFSNSGLVVSSEEDQYQDRICSLQDMGSHIMKIPLIGFQVLLFMHLEGTPSGARHIPRPVPFSPLFLLQGAGVLFSILRLVERLALFSRYLTIMSSRARDCFGFLHRGSRLAAGVVVN
ncbi:Transmembrane Fragile-X-F-associated protein [Macleaya cordata]|uniref:Transmembrane Fragile-X-F-associated protein n=1 Tax=Macleaya cordata TaxID=56857 RepID=A0A200RCJ1_MACCD|nr:Transmembrane Fragile-X-F-associated protein [Macleaya cordata]